jgi:hypothetical protein
MIKSKWLKLKELNISNHLLLRQQSGWIIGYFLFELQHMELYLKF